MKLLIMSAVFWLGFYTAISKFSAGNSGLKVQEYTAILQTIFAVVGIGLVVWQVRSLARNTEKMHEWNLRKSTADYLQNKKNLRKAYKKFREAKTKFTSQVFSKLEHGKDQDFVSHFIEILNYFEGLAVGIRVNVFHEEVAYRDMRGMLVSFYTFSKPHIDLTRKERNPRAYLALEFLAEKWSMRYAEEVKEEKTSQNSEMWIYEQ